MHKSWKQDTPAKPSGRAWTDPAATAIKTAKAPRNEHDAHQRLSDKARKR